MRHGHIHRLSAVKVFLIIIFVEKNVSLIFGTKSQLGVLP